MLDPMWSVTYTTDQRNRLLTRRIHNMIGAYFEDGTSFTFWYNDYFEQLDVPFHIRRDVTIPAGTYRFGEWMFMYRSDPSRRVTAGCSTRRRRSSTARAPICGPRSACGPRAASPPRPCSTAATSRCPAARSSPDLASLRLDLTLSPRMTFRSLSQWNSTTGELSNSIRFNWIYSPGSDIYIAYDELRLDGDPLGFDPHLRRPLWVRNRQLAIKMTYLLSR